MALPPEQQLTLIADFAAEILNQNDLDDILWLIIDRIINALDLEDCVIYAIDEGVSIVEEDELEQMQEEEEVIAADDDLEQVVEVPVLLHEEEVAIEAQPDLPYQLTCYYQT